MPKFLPPPQPPPRTSCRSQPAAFQMAIFAKTAEVATEAPETVANPAVAKMVATAKPPGSPIRIKAGISDKGCPKRRKPPLLLPKNPPRKSRKCRAKATRRPTTTSSSKAADTTTDIDGLQKNGSVSGAKPASLSSSSCGASPRFGQVFRCRSRVIPPRASVRPSSCA